MKKITIVFLLLILVFVNSLNFARANFGILDQVPVVDELSIETLSRIADVLDSILSTFGDEFKSLNLTASRILQSQFQQTADKVAVDSLKAQQYLNNLTEIDEFLKIREEKANSTTTYDEALEEARTVGAYLGLQQFSDNLDCLNPGIRDDLTDYVMGLTGDFNLSNEAEKVLNSIPDCFIEEETQPIALKPSFFTWLTQPFKLNLADVTQNNSEEVPPIDIVPEYQKSEDSIQLMNLKLGVESLIKKFVQQKEEERKKEIGKAWPVEKCEKFISSPDINGGKPLCEKYKTLIAGEDVEKFKINLALSNPLANTAQDINVFQVLTKPENTLNQIGVNSSSLNTTSSGLSGTFNSNDEIKKVIDRTCASYKIGESANTSSTTSTTVIDPTSAYALCMKEFNEQLNKLALILKTEVENKEKNATDTKNKIEEVKNKAEDLKNKIDPNVCPGAYDDLEEITNNLDGKIGIYAGLFAVLSQNKSQLNLLIKDINNFSLKANRLLNEVSSMSADVLEKINSFLDRFRGFTSILGLKFNLNETIIKDVMGKIKDFHNKILPKVRNTVQEFNNQINSLSNLIEVYNKLSYDLHQNNFTNSSVLNDIYEINLISQKLDVYDRMIARGDCSTQSGGSGKIVLIKNQVIVVESKKEQTKSSNFFALFKNLFEPKIVEIRNEK